MAMAEVLPLLLPLQYLFFSCLLSQTSAANSAFSSFSFPSFELENASSLPQPQPQLAIIGGHISNSCTLSLLPSGLVLYRKPIRFLDLGPTPAFSTYFSFSLSHLSSAPAPDFTFFLTLSSLGLSLPLLDSLHGPPPSVLSVTFSFLPSTPTPSSSHDNHNQNRLQIRVAGLVVPLRIKSRNQLVFTNGQKLHSWIDYTGTLNRLELRLATSRTARPESPILSYPMDLSHVLQREQMVAGFTSSSDDVNATHQLINAGQNYTLYEWTFAACRGAPYLMHSQPLDPSRFSSRPTDQNPSAPVMRRINHPWALVLALIFAAACGAMVTFFALFVWFSVCAHRPVAPVEYPVHPVEVIYEKIVLVGLKDVPDSNHK